MELNLVIAALSLGFAGSFHCAGMCGPIALALPLNNSSWANKIKGALVYNFGRALTYLLMGAFFGLISAGFVLAGFQKWISIIMGGIMVLSVLFPSIYRNRFDFEKSTFSFIGKLKFKLGKLLKTKSLPSLLFIGILNGLLPCGLVYIALAGAIATGNAFSGALFMFIFGIATLPMLFIISILGNTVSIQIRKRMTKIIPAIVLIVGILLIIRGLGLGIPYLSPPDKKLHVVEKADKTIHKCCSE